MPSVEIICVGQPEPSDFSTLPMAVEAENTLVSHRSPSPLFQAEFDELQGCIYHLGSPRLKNPEEVGFYTASDLLTEWWENLIFKPEFVPHIRHLLEELLAASPDGRLLFTSDYQFGTAARRYKRPLTLETFWKKHDANLLRVNALYPITRG